MHLSQNFVVAIYALFPPIFGGKKTDSANLSAFRMYVFGIVLMIVMTGGQLYVKPVDSQDMRLMSTFSSVFTSGSPSSSEWHHQTTVM